MYEYLMSRINETRFLVQHELCECKIYVIQNKNKTMIDINVNAKNQLTGVLMKEITCGVLVLVILRVRKSWILVLTCGDQILNTTEPVAIFIKKLHIKRSLPSSHYFIFNWEFIYVNCHVY